MVKYHSSRTSLWFSVNKIFFRRFSVLHFLLYFHHLPSACRNQLKHSNMKFLVLLIVSFLCIFFWPNIFTHNSWQNWLVLRLEYMFLGFLAVYIIWVSNQNRDAWNHFRIEIYIHCYSSNNKAIANKKR